MLERRSRRQDPAAVLQHQSLELRRKPGSLRFWVWLVPLVGLVVFSVNFVIRAYRAPGSDPNEPEQAVQATQRIVGQRLGPGVIPRFPPRNWIKVDREGDQYIVSSWVEAQNKYGGRSITYDFSCELLRNPDGYWYARKVDLQAQ